MFKRRAILVDFTLLTDKWGEPNYFLLKMCDNLEVTNYSDLIVLAKDPVSAREWLDNNCVGHNLVYQTNYDLFDDVKKIRKTHKTIGAIVSKKFDTANINQRFIPIMRIVGR